MELVYLWVEENDLIKGTDFNFGSKYIFSFKKEQQENKGTLSIEDNPNFIEKFYRDNITVSAIVGKNGAGKTQLLNLIWNGGIKSREYFAIVKIKNSLDFILISDKDLKISIQGLKINLEFNKGSLDNFTNFFYTNEFTCLDSFNLQVKGEPTLNPIRISEKYKFISVECYKKDIINENSPFLEKIDSAVDSQLDEINTYHDEVVDGIECEGKDFTPNDIDNYKLYAIQEMLGKIYTYENIHEILDSKIFLQILNLIYDRNINWYKDIQIPTELTISINEKRCDDIVYKRKFFGYQSKLELEDSSISNKIFIYYLYNLWDYISDNPSISEEDRIAYLDFFKEYISENLKAPQKILLKRKKSFLKK